MFTSDEAKSTDRDERFRSTDALDNSNSDVIRAARAQLIEAEMALRNLWYDTIDQSPTLAARVNTAVRFAHLAAEALTAETLL